MPDSPRHGFHFRGQLPHLTTGGATYFVTFRLAGSLPATAIADLKQQRATLLHNAMAAGRPLTWREERELFAWYSDKVETLLDAGTGSCWLSQSAVAELVARALSFFQTTR